MIRSLRPFALLPLLLLAACQSPGDDAGTPTPTPADLAATPPPDSGSASSDLPIKHPSATDMPVPGSGLPPADTVGASGFGAMHFGMHRFDVEKLAGDSLEAPGADGKACYIAHRSGEQQIDYVFIDDKLARIDVRTPGVLAVGGGRVGMHVDEIRTLYAGHLSEQSDKIDPAMHLLKIGGDTPGNGGVIFEIDRNGTVTGYRAGLPPALDAGEGCS